ncbi:MFS transporter [Terrabacter sp. MAHUQ-38]|uniref:MFS transporter n=1 Tax=unclassified Terrabacter TaxID=2630222 RepID=UPI00165D5917|nr:MFS transporter [Terrabacter sp. MAHUQ-38]MBC9822577.1 MFS transporter [Terrabacter sp. MAHUQ-38]
MTPTRAIRIVLTSNAIEHLAFRFTQLALPLVVLSEFDSAAAAGLVGGLAGLPVVTSPWWARRLRQRLSDGRGLALVSLWQAAAVLVVPTAMLVGALHLVVLAVAGLAVGVSDALASPARTALLGDLGDRLGEGMATRVVTWDDALRRGAMVVGPGLAGLGVHLGWTNALLWVEGLALVVSALVVRRVVLAPAAPTSPAPAAPTAPTAHRARTERASAPGPTKTAGHAPGILASVRPHPDIMRGWVMRGTSCLLWFAFALGLAVQGERTGQSGTLYATALTAYGLGSFAMTLAVAARPPASRPLRVAALSWAGQGLAFGAMAVWTTPVPVAIWSAAAGMATVIGIRAMTQLLLVQTTGPARRAALAGQSILVDVTVSAGMLSGGLVIDLVGVRAALGAAGLAIAAVALVAGLSTGEGRQPRRVPAAATARG